MAYHYLRYFAMSLLALVAAVVLSCAQPVAAQTSRTASGQYIDCGQLVADVSLGVHAYMRGSIEPGAKAKTDWYTRVVLAHVAVAVSQDNPQEYVRALHKQCLLESA